MRQSVTLARIVYGELYWNFRMKLMWFFGWSADV